MIEESVQAFIPAFNEEATIGTVIERTHGVLSRHCGSFEVLAFDDGSTDATPRICDEAAKRLGGVRVVHRKVNGGGWGPVVKYAFLNCKHDWLVIVDSDMQFDPCDLEKFMPYLPDHDIVISGRKDRQDSAMRKLITFMDKLLLKLLFGVSFYDLHWIKFIRMSFVDKTLISGDSPFIETDVLIRAKRRGARVKEIWLPHYPRLHGTATGASFRNVYRSMRDMLGLYIRLRGTAR
ncbi:MAG: hypothetical protein A2X93_00770 [Deltaproteobacteria bacterium GWC2_56_8]|nr:MAG: hypothetical protein A2X99_04810 [Deltaproteobacteria bacterium GWB2_55_19]OGP32175.1 MAG: hypothetical protein A2X93_00770 [Deltaproteobacteria bacterium GWC2_56_8]HAO93069.1 hypothetical protein [Deltaproteobacteria bacterium]